ncbi:MAG: UDP-GlcNAc:undecaprenyl-phosphate GlcNAc-1-phosphate transferase [Algoriphagus sp.]|jgi:UDP-GlcNAc:undecaprenyl-phosphate GlcNAc-1-phosphate transferase
MILQSIIQFFILLGLMLIYLRLADRFNIIDKPNQRSSHKLITVRGGGIIFMLAAILWFFWTGLTSPFFISGLVLISLISFLDDLYTLNVKPRLIVHLLAVFLLGYQLGLTEYPGYWWLIYVVFIIGWINAFNFMDGINGITAFYSLAVLIPLYWINQKYAFVEEGLIIITAISLVVFAIFNARGRARCFAGDVGSVSMAFIIAYMMGALIIKSCHWEYILLLSVYGVDAVLTIINRFIKGENIFEAHRSHLYQYLANEVGLSHLKVSAIYAFVQLGISSSVVLMILSAQAWWTFIFLLLGLGILYLLIKSYVNKKYVAG